MKKSLIIMLLLALISIATYAKGGKSSSFGKWNYDKFGEASQHLTKSEASQISNVSDACRQYVHVSTKFHVRVKNWFRFVQIGRSGYAEMRATLGTATKSCNIPYNIARMDIYYDRTKHVTSINKNYLKATMKGIGAVNECYNAIGYAYTNSGIVLPNNYRSAISVHSSNNAIRGVPSSGIDTVSRIDQNSERVELENVPVSQISFATPPPTYNEPELTIGDVVTGITTVDVSGVPYANVSVPVGWLRPGSVGLHQAVSVKPYAGAILNDTKGCYNTGKFNVEIKF